MRSKWDKELQLMSDEELESLPLEKLLRIRNKRWAWQKPELEKRALEELARRNPKKDWKCSGCGRTEFHEKQARVAGSMVASWFGLETNQFHAIICDYCGKTDLYSVLREGSLATDFLIGGG